MHDIEKKKRRRDDVLKWRVATANVKKMELSRLKCDKSFIQLWKRRLDW